MLGEIKMLVNQKKLSIAIPSYNRCKYLDLLLASILKQYNDCASLVEIIVSDNASTDATPQVVAKYIEFGLAIKYIRNVENLGPDRNIAQCFSLATGEYVWIMGDDDYFLDQALVTVLGVINKTQSDPIGIIHVSATSKSLVPKEINLIKLEQSISRDDFVKKINVFLTFISGNIVNKNIFINNCDLELINQYLDTNLVQLSWTYQIIIHSINFAIIETPLIFAQAENSGGYNIFNVFAVSQSKIAQIELKNYPKYIKLIEKGTMLKCFPVWIHLYLCNRLTSFEKTEQDIFQVLQSAYGKYFEFWVLIYPMKFMPVFIRRVFKKLVVLFWNFSLWIR